MGSQTIQVWSDVSVQVNAMEIQEISRAIVISQLREMPQEGAAPAGYTVYSTVEEGGCTLRNPLSTRK